MNLMRIITIGAMGALAAGLLGCSWGDAQFEWPWSRQSAPVTYPAWTSPEDWPQGPPQPRKDPKIATTRQAASRPAEGRDKPIPIGDPREIITSVLPIKGKFIKIKEILQEAKKELSAIECDEREKFEKEVRRVIDRVIRRRINNELIFSEANARLTKPQKEHVKTQVADILSGMIADADGSRTKLKELLAKDDITDQELLDEHERRITVGLYKRIKFFPAISITRQMLLGYYNKHKTEDRPGPECKHRAFRVGKKVGMHLIYVPFEKFLKENVAGIPSEEELKKARAAAKEVIDKADTLLKNGTDFEEVARELSKELSSVKLDPPQLAGNLATEVDKAAFALKQGEISGIVETSLLKGSDGKIVNYGRFYIVKASEVLEGTTTSFEDAQEEINKILREEQLTRLSKKFTDRMFKESKPQSPDFTDATVKQAIELHWKPPKNP